MTNMIVAVSKNGVIGKDGILPWKIKEDLRKFKELTMGGVLFVGKKTASTLPTLTGREVIILCRDKFPTLTDITTWDETKEKWIIGGAAIYSASLANDIVDIVYLTIINKEYDGDTFFNLSDITSNTKWVLVKQETLREQEPVVTLQTWKNIRNKV